MENVIVGGVQIRRLGVAGVSRVWFGFGFGFELGFLPTEGFFLRLHIGYVGGLDV
jgi:hypothetical protein